MREDTTRYLQRKKQNKRIRYIFRDVAVCLSLFVVVGVFWYLKLTGVTLAGEAFCGIDEHVHNEECNVRTLICSLEENTGHTHTEECYTAEYTCGLEEGQEHTHTEECRSLSLVCTLDTAQAHTHTEYCYDSVLTCQRGEHIHTPGCYSNDKADIETEDDWTAAFADLERGRSTAENVLLIAKTQIGYTESTANYQLGDDGERRGITRYGQWYGNPYGDWSSMFVMFCMNYAGVADLPANAGPESLRLAWETDGLYVSAEEFSPMAGDILFLSKSGQGTADAVALIESVSDTEIIVIEGDVDRTVAEVVYAIDSSEILGYGIIPELSEYAAVFAAPEGTNPLGTITSYNTVNNVGTNFWFGMSVEVDFYIPLAPGALTASGEYGNKDIYGADMHFRFTGDDDVWIFVDDTLVLDLGGLHGRETGDINFSTGTVTINGVVNEELSRALQSITAGEHKLTLYYMERGSSMSNCAIYFNLAPRFSFSIEKEDVLTRDVLNGAQFSVYTDRECTIPAELWVSKESHDRGDPATNVFTVTDGVAHMWGMGAGNEYYIKETKPPDDPAYGLPNGIICASLDKVGTASYNVEIIDDGSGISGGFIVHGFRIDAETQSAYIVATNAPKWVKETTSVEVMKYWDDSLDHTDEEITVYLTVTDPDGTVRRLQEAVVSAETEWRASWDNLPKYAEDGVTPIKYGVEESYVSGYYSSVETAEGRFEISKTQWRTANGFQNGKVYILKNSNGQALSTQRYAEDTGYMWVSEETAKTSELARWTASLNGNSVRLTNLAGQTITFYYGNGTPTDFFALNQYLEDNNRKQYFVYENRNGGVTLRYNNYYLYPTLNGSQKFENGTQAGNAMVLTLMTEESVSISIPIEGEGFLVTNTPLERETSVTVTKNWSLPQDMDESIYQQQQVTLRLFANGSDTGRTLTLDLKNGWQGAFRGLPYEDADGNVIEYTVREVQIRD